MPQPKSGEVLVRVRACGVCRTDLHVVEGELPPRKSPVIPGHQVVGVIEKLGDGAQRFAVGARVGIAWLHQTDGTCEYCRSGAENLCDNPIFTGYSADGGYAEYLVAPQDFVYTIPEGFPDELAAPLLCAGIIGFRSLRLSSIKAGGRLGFYGFGAAAHVAIQVARHWGVEVFVCTRDARHQKLALELGAAWAGGTFNEPPKKLDAAIIFAPAGEIVPAALKALKKGGALVLGGIHMSSIPSFDYQLLYQERGEQYAAGRRGLLACRGGDSDSSARTSLSSRRGQPRAQCAEERCHPRRCTPSRRRVTRSISCTRPEDKLRWRSRGRTGACERCLTMED